MHVVLVVMSVAAPGALAVAAAVRPIAARRVRAVVPVRVTRR
ncbi:MAG TPA: hypothetical protein VMV02_05820 [Acidimicrobiales bacterium]|nr:hypothetical protein [Acidimicrobiales bacterium]